MMFMEELVAAEDEGTMADIRKRLAEVLQSVIEEMTSCYDKVEVSFTEGDKTTVYRVVVPEEVRGKLIGAQGKNIMSLRNIIGAMSGNHGFRAIIELVI